MIDFQPFTLENRELINRYLQLGGYQSCEYCFEGFYLWQNSYQDSFAVLGDFMIIRSVSAEGVGYLAPIGRGDAKAAIEKLRAHNAQTGEKLKFLRVSSDNLDRFQSVLDRFEMVRKRDLDDYIYRAESLAQLPGKKLHPKRTHINKFQRLYENWSYEPITEANLGECVEMNREWCRDHNCTMSGDLQSESTACFRGLKYFKILGMLGGLIRVNGKVVAFTVASPLYPGSNTVVVHFEKALREYEGAYTMINQQFAQSVAGRYEYIDREEDMGVEGLRKAKLSYCPEIMKEKYTLLAKD